MRRHRCWILCSLLLACGTDEAGFSDNTGAPGNGGTAGGGPSGATATPQTLSHEQLALVLLDANANEVGDGGLALARAQSGAVVDFALKMIADHGMALQKARADLAAASIVPAQSPVGAQRAIAGVGTQQQLRSVQLPHFDLAFMCTEVQEHQDVIAFIDAQLPNAGPLAPDMQAGRDMAAQHLALAQQIIGQLAPSTNGDDPCTPFAGGGTTGP